MALEARKSLPEGYRKAGRLNLGRNKLMAAVPAGLLTEMVLVLVLNSAGAVGHLVALVWLLTQPRSAYVNDYGDGLVVYASSGAI
jgi:hypothetical protein